MNRIYAFIISCLCAYLTCNPLKVYAAEYQFKWDALYRIETIAANTSSAYRLIGKHENNIFRESFFNNPGGRLIKFVIDEEIARWLVVFNHEYGHFWRGGRKGKIVASAPFTNRGARVEGTGDGLPVTAGGMEAHFVLDRLMAESIHSDTYTSHDSILYSTNKAINIYIISGANMSSQSGERDSKRYIESFSTISYSDLRYGMWWNAIDPTVIKSLYDIFYSNIWKGKDEFSLPEFWIGTAFHPSYLGPEYYLNFYYRGEYRYRFYTRLGYGDNGSFYGWGLKVKALEFKLPALNSFLVVPQIDIWKQESKPGINIQGEIEKEVASMVYVTTRLGYKTSGFLGGEGHNKGVHWDIGIKMKF